MEDSKLIGEVLDGIIQEKETNLTELSKKAGLSQSYLSKIISGKMPKLPVVTLNRIVKALGFDMSEFWQFVEKKTPKPMSI